MGAADWYEIRWGRFRLWAARATTPNGRDIVVHEPSQGADRVIQDRGPKLRITQLELLFDEIPNEPQSAKDRFLAFKAQVEAGTEELFVHPVDGSTRARVQDLEYTIDEDSNIVEASCSIVPVAEVETVRAAATGTSLRAGGDLVTAAADDLATELDAIDIESTIPTDATVALASWSDSTDVPTRQVLADAAALNAAIETLIDDEDLETDLEKWDAYVAAIRLQAAFRAAAQSATAETPSIFFLRLAAPSSILALVTRIYGGREAADRERQVRALNDIVTVGGMIPAGTELAMPAKSNRRAA